MYKRQHNDPTLRDLADTIEQQKTGHNTFAYMLNAMAYIGNYVSVAVDVAEAQRVDLLNSRNIFFTEAWWQKKLSEFQFYTNDELKETPNIAELVERNGDLVYSAIDRSKQRIALASISVAPNTNTAIFYALESGNDDALGTELDPSAGTYPSLYKPFPTTGSAEADAERTQLTRYITQIIPLPSAFVIGNVGRGTTTQRVHVMIDSRVSTEGKNTGNAVNYDKSVYASDEEAMAAVKRQLDTFMANNQLKVVSSDALYCEIQNTKGINGMGNINLRYFTVETDGTMELWNQHTPGVHRSLIDKNIYWSYSLGGAIFLTPGDDDTKTEYILDFNGISS